MATGKLAKREVNVQGLINDSDAMRKLVQDEVQKMTSKEFKEHMGRDRKIVSESLFVAERVSETGYREILGVAMGNSESE